MPGSLTPPDRGGARNTAPPRLAFRYLNSVGVRYCNPFVARWPACALPCQRFALRLAAHDA